MRRVGIGLASFCSSEIRILRQTIISATAKMPIAMGTDIEACENENY